MRIALTAAYMYRTCGNVSEAKNWAFKACESGTKNVYSKLAKELLEEC